MLDEMASTTNQQVRQPSRTTNGSGREPDESFYIENCEAVRGRQRINLEVDPPPDLAIEIDLLSYTVQ